MEDSELQLMTAIEVADILKMNPQVIARKLASGEMEGYKIGKDWRVSKVQLMNFLEYHSNKRSNRLSPSEKVIKSFFVNGKLKEIPASRTKRLHVLKHLVNQLSEKVYTEKQINSFLKGYHSDVCTLRREFVANKLMVRKDGKYKKTTWQVD